MQPPATRPGYSDFVMTKRPTKKQRTSSPWAVYQNGTENLDLWAVQAIVAGVALSPKPQGKRLWLAGP